MRTKVFVGNLSFATKENELSKEFEAAGKVISANIITRGPRSLGYGFVEMDNEEDAEKAVQLLDKKEIDGRPINVEVAKPREEGAENAEKPQGSTRGGRGGRGGARGSRGGFRGTRGSARGAPRGGAVGASGDAQPRRRNNFRREDEGEEGSQQQQQSGEQQQGEGRRGGRGRGRGSRGGARGGQPRVQRDEKREDTRTPSQTTLFVANLPFTLETEGFETILKDSQLAYKSAHVVKKKTGRSKGFGFVEFDNEVDQQKALSAINNKQVEGRELVAKVALTENKPVEGETATTATTTDAKVSTPKVENKTTTASPKADKQ